MKDSKTLRGEVKALYTDYTAKLDELKDGEPTAEQKQYLDRLTADMDAKVIEAQETEAREASGSKAGAWLNSGTGHPGFSTKEAEGSDPAGEGDDPADAADEPELKSYWDRVQTTPETKQKRAVLLKYLRFGDNSRLYGSLNTAQRKALSESLDVEGGYTVPVDFQAELIRQLPDFTFVRGMATQRTTSRDSVAIPRVKGATGNDANIFSTGVTITWGGETSTVTETDMDFENVEIPIYKMRALVKLSRDVLEDSAVNLEAEVMSALSESMGLEEDRVFINGSGVLRPLGIIGDTDISTTTTAVALTIGADDIYDLIASQPTQYAKNGTLVMARSVWSTIRKLKDGMGQYLWVPGLEKGAVANILGYPVQLSPFMPASAASTIVVLFGDFRYFRIYDRPGMTVQRVNELYAESDQVGIIVRRRLGAGVTLPQGFKTLTVHA